MRNELKLTLIILNIAGLIIMLIWLKENPGWEPISVILGQIGLLIIQIKNVNNDNKVKMNQKGGKNSNNYQSGRDINLNK